MNAPDLKASIIFHSIMSHEPLPLDPDRGTSPMPVDVPSASAGSATRCDGGARGMAVALAAIFIAGFTLGFFFGVLHG